MKRLLVTIALALQPSIIFLLGGGDLTKVGFDLGFTYLVSLLVAAFVWSYPGWTEGK